jgi:hypothetical protein
VLLEHYTQLVPDGCYPGLQVMQNPLVELQVKQVEEQFKQASVPSEYVLLGQAVQLVPFTLGVKPALQMH